jgi:transposase
MSKKKQFIGIDVSKAQLEVAAHNSDYRFRCSNKESAFSELIAELIALRPKIIVLEATGGLEIPVVTALYAAGLPVVVVNPRQIRDFAKAVGQLAKTDKLDASVLAHFAAAIQPALRPVGTGCPGSTAPSISRDAGCREDSTQHYGHCTHAPRSPKAH